jgi:predicted dithiol-disulfide oxidoreductase (DUF899 family)
MELPPIVSEKEWQRSHETLMEKEKEETRARDALAAERRRQPMTAISPEYAFEGPDGTITLADLFQGRDQLIVYHFWFPAGGKPCDGCSMFTDQIGHLAHINARDTTFALVSPASQPDIDAFKTRMGWSIPWYTVVGDEFQKARGTTEYFKLDVFLRDGERVFLAYSTQARGVEALGSVWTFLDLTPLGRQEEWEETPPGRPQTPKYGWWRLHDEYEPSQTGARS